MLDTKDHTKKVDLHYIDPNDYTEVQYLHSKYPWISEKEIKSVIEKQGPERRRVERYLDRCHS